MQTDRPGHKIFARASSAVRQPGDKCPPTRIIPWPLARPLLPMLSKLDILPETRP
jgi:hypothetical protein